jgi:hypothetical protein
MCRNVAPLSLPEGIKKVRGRLEVRDLASSGESIEERQMKRDSEKLALARG